MASVTLTQLRARVRELADMVGSSFVSDAATSLDAFINAAADELYDLLIQELDGYAMTSTALATVANTGTYSLPTGFYKLDGVDLVINGTSYALEKFNFRERHRYQSASTSPLGSDLPLYSLEGNLLRLRPTPTAVYSGTIWYRPTRTQQAVASDTLDGISGWEEYVVVGAAIRCLQKEESDYSGLLPMLAALKQRIQESAKDRDVGAPFSVVDVEGLNDW